MILHLLFCHSDVLLLCNMTFYQVLNHYISADVKLQSYNWINQIMKLYQAVEEAVNKL